jgi:hypothetical protein
METIIQGGTLMLFLSNKSIPLATNHTLRISAETNDNSNKDVASGIWASSSVKQLSWEATTDNLYSHNGAGSLFQLMADRAQIPALFCAKSQSDTAPLPESGTWTPSTTHVQFSGNVIITSLEITAQNGENATFSATFTGVGALTRVSGSADSYDTGEANVPG